jgi:hypothetical protein
MAFMARRLEAARPTRHTGAKSQKAHLCILLALGALIPGREKIRLVVPNVGRIIFQRVILIEETVEFIETLGVGNSGRAGLAKPPLSDKNRAVAGRRRMLGRFVCAVTTVGSAPRNCLRVAAMLCLLGSRSAPLTVAVLYYSAR